MSSVTKITQSAQLATFIKNNPNCVVFYGSSDCNHCITIKPFFEKLPYMYRSIGFACVDISKVKVSGLTVVPTFIAYKNGVAVEKISSGDSDDIIEMIKFKILQ
jgi:thiol-disulfide isomerase/thioredoxin